MRPNKEPKHAAHARIHVEDLVQTVPTVVAISNSNTPSVSDRFHESLRLGRYGLVRQTYSEGSYSSHRQLSQLLASKNHCLVGSRRKVTVAHPHRVDIAGNV